MSTDLDFFSPDKLKAKRLLVGLTQAEAAAAAKISRNRWVRYERGEFAPRPPRLLELAAAVSATPEEICDLPELEEQTIGQVRALAGYTQQSAAEELKEHWTTSKAYRQFELGLQGSFTSEQIDALAELYNLDSDVMETIVSNTISQTELENSAVTAASGF